MHDDGKLDEVKTILRRLQRIGTGEDDGADNAAAEDGPQGQGSADRAWSRHAVAAEVAVKKPPSAEPPAPVATGTAVASPPSSPARGRLAAVAVAGLILGAVGLGVILWPDRKPPSSIEKSPVQKAERPKNIDSGQTVTTAATQPQQGGAIQNTAVPENGTRSTAGPDLAEGQSADPLFQAQRLIGEGKIVAGRELLLAGPADRTADAALALARSYDPNSLRLIPNADAPPDTAEAERWYRRWHELAAVQGLALDGPRLDRIIKAMK